MYRNARNPAVRGTFFGVQVLSCIAAGVLTGCGPGSVPGNSDAPLSSATEVYLSSVPTQRILAERGSHREWRDGHRFEEDSAHHLVLGENPRAQALAIGYYADGPDTIHAKLFVGGQSVRSIDLEGTRRAWNDVRVDLSGIDTGARPTLQLESSSSFFLSHVRFIPAARPRTPIVVFLIDTLRQDHLGCYGYPRPVSPNLDRFARDSVRFTQLVPASSWTRPSVASLLTSTYSSVHGANDRGDSVRSGLPWLADVLGEYHYLSHGIMTNINCLPMWGFGHDFDVFEDVGAKDWINIDDVDAVAAAEEALRHLDGVPFFLYVHTIAPHEPYDPPEVFERRFLRDATGLSVAEAARQRTIDRYDAEIAYIDSLFGRFIRTMKDLRLYDSSLIVVLSDHGEEFWEHGGTSHGKNLFEEQLRVPFLVKLPRNANAGSTVDTLVEMVDIAPTVLDWVELPLMPAFQGESIARNVTSLSERPRIGHASLRLDAVSIDTAKTTRYKFVLNRKANSREWFDLAADSREHDPLRTRPEDAPPLDFVVDERARMGNVGLNILVTHDATENRLVEGRLSASNVGSVEIDYPEEHVRLTRRDGVIEFAVLMQDAADSAIASARWRRALAHDAIMQRIVNLAPERIASEPDHFTMTVTLPEHESVRISMSLDGIPIPAAAISLPRGDAHVALDDVPLELADIKAGPRHFDPVALHHEFGVYLWYVPPADRTPVSELDDESRATLEALGYLDANRN